MDEKWRGDIEELMRRLWIPIVLQADGNEERRVSNKESG
jgi:hypothetical protein